MALVRNSRIQRLVFTVKVGNLSFLPGVPDNGAPTVEYTILKLRIDDHIYVSNNNMTKLHSTMVTSKCRLSNTAILIT